VGHYRVRRLFHAIVSINPQLIRNHISGSQSELMFSFLCYLFLSSPP